MGDLFQQLWVASVAPRQGKLLEQTRGAPVKHGMIVPAGLVAERAGQPALSDTAWASDEQVLVRLDPAACGKFRYQRQI